VLGQQAVVEFFGEQKDVPTSELSVAEEPENAVHAGPMDDGRVLFRRAFEALNLGVVPPEPDQLLRLSIGGDALEKKTERWLREARRAGFCKVVFGDYGTGKTHNLRVIEAAALRRGWVVSFVEFDPKQADAAKPHLVYREIARNLKFPMREDGSRSRGFYDLIGEVRSKWHLVAGGKYFNSSPWFEPAVRALRFHTHSEDPEYRDAIAWLAGQGVNHSVIRDLCRRTGGRVVAPRAMPKVLETADIYVHHLVVINEWCRLLGYQGLLIILDEAEHVRGYNVRRFERATNFFDWLARAAHAPLDDAPPPNANEHGIALPPFWREGPHFGLVVALTEGDTFGDPSVALRDACVFLHDESDRITLTPPKPSDYRDWCEILLTDFERHYPERTSLLMEPSVRSQIAHVLADEYRKHKNGERTIRVWGKLASFAVALLLAGAATTQSELEDQLRRAAREATGEILPWES